MLLSRITIALLVINFRGTWCQSLEVRSKNTNPALQSMKLSIKLASVNVGNGVIKTKSLKCGTGKDDGNGQLTLKGFATYSFSRKQFSLSTSEYKSRLTVVTKTTLELKDIKFSDHGIKIFCDLEVTKEGSNLVSKRSSIFSVKVEGKPLPVSPLPDQSYSKLENSSLSIKCIFEGYPVPVVEWTWNATPNPTNKVTKTVTGSRPIKVVSELSLTNLQKSDASSYKCKGVNKHGSSEKNMNVDVHYPPYFDTPNNHKEFQVCNGQLLKFSCPALGYPIPQITLSKDSNIIKNGTIKIEFEKTVTSDDYGDYVCSATNTHGSTTVRIQVVRKDDSRKAPLLVTKAGESKLIVNWNNIKCSSDHYNRTFVIYLSNDQNLRLSTQVTCLTSKCTTEFNDLENDVRYSVQASSIDKDGNPGPRSQIMFATPVPEKATSIGFIIGVAIGGILILIICGAVIFFCCCRGNLKSVDDPDTNKLKAMDQPSISSDQVYQGLEESRYVIPVSKGTDSIYESLQPSSTKRHSIIACGTDQEIDPSKLNIIKQIHQGTFWNVHHGTLLCGDNEKTAVYWNVAVKELKETPSTAERKEFCNRCNALSLTGEHKNILIGLGLITKFDPVRLIVEYAQHGDLLRFLRKTRGIDNDYYNVHVEPKSYLREEELTQFALDIANGMQFLSQKRIVHSLLTAKTVMVFTHGATKLCKISIHESLKKVVAIPGRNSVKQERANYKWTALEVLQNGNPTTQSDVWSFGVVLYEIFTVGAVPYVNVPAAQVLDVLKVGKRLERLPYIDNSMSDEMAECWLTYPNQRPTFNDLVIFLESYLSKQKVQRRRNEKLLSRVDSYDDIVEDKSKRPSSEHSVLPEELYIEMKEDDTAIENTRF